MVRRLFGVLLLLIAVGGVIIALLGIRLGTQLVDNTAANLSATLALTADSLETVTDSLLLIKATVAGLEATVTTSETTADNLAQAISETRPLLTQVTAVASEDVPDSLTSVQATFPGLEQVAGIIDRTLVTLNSFRIDESILGLRLNYDLGIDYDPAVPFDQTVHQLGQSLEGLPEALRSLKIYLNVTNNNLGTISRDIRALADDLAAINGQLGELDPILDEYLRLVTAVSDSTRQQQAQIDDQAAQAKTAVTVAMAWLALSQLAPFFLGWELLIGRRAAAVEVLPGPTNANASPEAAV